MEDRQTNKVALTTALKPDDISDTYFYMQTSVSALGGETDTIRAFNGILQ